MQREKIWKGNSTDIFGICLLTSGKQWISANYRHRIAKGKKWEGRIRIPSEGHSKRCHPGSFPKGIPGMFAWNHALPPTAQAALSPQGKRLVIEHATVIAETESGRMLAQIASTIVSEQTPYWLVLTEQGPVGGTPAFLGKSTDPGVRRPWDKCLWYCQPQQRFHWNWQWCNQHLWTFCRSSIGKV